MVGRGRIRGKKPSTVVPKSDGKALRLALTEMLRGLSEQGHAKFQTSNAVLDQVKAGSPWWPTRYALSRSAPNNSPSRIGGRLDEVHDSLRLAIKSIYTVASMDMIFALQSKHRVQGTMVRISEINQEMSASARQINAHTDQVSGRVNAAVTALPFRDTTNQLIDHAKRRVESVMPWSPRRWSKSGQVMTWHRGSRARGTGSLNRSGTERCTGARPNALGVIMTDMSK